MKSLLITGGAGFIGSNFISLIIKKYRDYKIINLDLLTYAGNLDNTKEFKHNCRYKFIQGDICDRRLVEKLFRQFKIEGVIHFAAESHVDNSISSGEVFMKTNIIGTFTLLDVAKDFWRKKPKARFHHISTDEVYGALGKNGFFNEDTPYAPNSPYSASKASADMVVRSYHQTYNLDTVITNCSNNYGPKQHDEKLIPTIIRQALRGKQIPIYGNGKNIRDWIFVEDHCRAIDLVFHRGKTGETYNIGARNEKRNLDLAREICAILDDLKPLSKGIKYKSLVQFVPDRPGHDWRYAIDPAKIEKKLKFKPQKSFESGLLKTVQWYMNKYLVKDSQ